ncbi:hypothetical protein BpHYR1_031477 [Brachionus plicatilis]|uniref:Uncharacterized protein n=1 Tax=Brachionus plicatilis TaxID=10195 RepID=A0A3M7PHU6_BRAPC|nr:hypothetical protein BpHYR1_031477 [Brachionus plicatilis]
MVEAMLKIAIVGQFGCDLTDESGICALEQYLIRPNREFLKFLWSSSSMTFKAVWFYSASKLTFISVCELS